jgi:hypothetical protein
VFVLCTVICLKLVDDDCSKSRFIVHHVENGKRKVKRTDFFRVFEKNSIFQFFSHFSQKEIICLILQDGLTPHPLQIMIPNFSAADQDDQARE